jgi:DNA-binding GntR family transcriptional regulator
MTSADGVDMPLTQDELGKILGLSLVHVNRTLQQLRRDGLLEMKQGRVTFRGRDALVRLCGFDEVAQAYAQAI